MQNKLSLNKILRVVEFFIFIFLGNKIVFVSVLVDYIIYRWLTLHRKLD
jgi:hypothetical protein